MRFHAFTLIAALTITSAVWAQPGDGHYVGSVPQGVSKEYRQLCSPLSVDVTIADGVITGTTKKTIFPIGSHTLTVYQQPLTGTVSESNATAKLYGSNFPVDLSNGRFVAKYVGPQCDYDFDLPQVN
jgi:hypothetical protein